MNGDRLEFWREATYWETHVYNIKAREKEPDSVIDDGYYGEEYGEELQWYYEQ